MPAVRGVQHGLICDCCAPTAGAESLAEVAFAKSAAAAAQSGDFFRLKSLITRNPAAVHDDGYGGSSGYTPVIYAARQGHVDCVELLLACGAAPDAATAAGGATALQRAAYMGHLRVVQLLLDAGATAALQDGDGQTALHKAAERGHADVAAALVAAAPQLAGVRDKRGRTAADLAQTPAAAAAAGGTPA
ncbi:Ankyrin repeat domain-containing 39 [Micractinium conductrix]|uniref:Ankyrin repeat domain-containing 39 n=1 Tax=Micractinium conductrix TaxID=554055 RepID=A0A2P6VSF0_9CHLO|nr:Ankyrin repeat domain-containing 39 [Micractinium conductrix]|eukprot:PSC77021.1 Ankyrin repeat domain-containing 39 [Micractinium conductrix]